MALPGPPMPDRCALALNRAGVWAEGFGVPAWKSLNGCRPFSGEKYIAGPSASGVATISDEDGYGAVRCDDVGFV